MSKVSMEVADTRPWEQSLNEVACLKQMLNSGEFSAPPEADKHEPKSFRISFWTESCQLEIVVK